MASSSSLPILLPPKSIPPVQPSPHEWTPQKNLSLPVPPPTDDMTHEQEMAALRQAMDGRPVKKVRPRRTVDYTGPMGRLTLVSNLVRDTTRVFSLPVVYSYGNCGLRRRMRHICGLRLRISSMYEGQNMYPYIAYQLNDISPPSYYHLRHIRITTPRHCAPNSCIRPRIKSVAP